MVDDIDTIFAALVGLGAGVGIFYGGFQARSRYKLLERTPTSKVRSLALGLAEVRGRVERAEDVHKSPFAQQECVYYSYRVQERRRSRDNDSWETIAEGSTDTPFYLRDETGRVLIAPRGADCCLEPDRRYTTEGFSSSARDAEFRSGIIRLGIPYEKFIDGNPLRASEVYICPGDELFVVGCAKLRSSTPMSATNVENLFIGSGAEWFSISEKSERQVLSSLRGKMYGMILGGPALAVGCLAYLLHRFHVE